MVKGGANAGSGDKREREREIWLTDLCSGLVFESNLSRLSRPKDRHVCRVVDMRERLICVAKTPSSLSAEEVVL